MNTIVNLVATIWNLATGEERRLRDFLVSVAVATFGGVFLLIVFSPSISWSFVITFPIWIWTCYRIFSIDRYVRIHILGEGLDLFKFTPSSGHVLDNDLARLYRKLVASILLFQSTLFLGVPLYFNYSQGYRSLLVIILIISVMITLVSWKFSRAAFSVVASLIIVVFSLGIFHEMFPQVSVLTGANKTYERSVSGETAKKINEISLIRKEQKDSINNSLLDAAKNWQLANPGKDLPLEFQELLEAASKGLTPSQLRESKKNKPQEQTREISKKEEVVVVSKVVKITGNKPWSGSIDIPPSQGKHKVSCTGGVNRLFGNGATRFIPPEGIPLSSSLPPSIWLLCPDLKTDRYGQVVAEMEDGRVIAIGREGIIEGSGKVKFSQNLSYFFEKNEGEVICKID